MGTADSEVQRSHTWRVGGSRGHVRGLEVLSFLGGKVSKKEELFDRTLVVEPST